MTPSSLPVLVPTRLLHPVVDGGGSLGVGVGLSVGGSAVHIYHSLDCQLRLLNEPLPVDWFRLKLGIPKLSEFQSIYKVL